MDLKELGFTKEELQQRVIDQIVSQVLAGATYDEDGNEIETKSRFARELDSKIQKHIEETIDKVAKKHILPNVKDYVEKLTLQETTKWGEKRGAKLTFIEYLVSRAEAWITEEVNHNGKSKDQESYSWRGCQTRIAHMIHEHLQYNIERAMKEALSNANASIAKGLQETVKIKLAEVLANLEKAKR